MFRDDVWRHRARANSGTSPILAQVAKFGGVVLGGILVVCSLYRLGWSSA